MTGNIPLNDEPLLPAMIVEDSWTVTWPRVIARSWIDPNFKTLLLRDAPAAFREMGFSGQAASGGKEFDIWKLLSLKVIDANSDEPGIVEIPTEPSLSQYIPVSEQRGKEGTYDFNGWSNAIDNGQLKMFLTLTLPPAPDDKCQAMAIADWTAAGKISPLTCGFF